MGRARRVARRRVERGEVVVVELDLGTLGDLIAEADEDVFDLAHRLRDEVLVPGREGVAGQRDVDALFGQRRAQERLLEGRRAPPPGPPARAGPGCRPCPAAGRCSGGRLGMERSSSVSALLRPRAETRACSRASRSAARRMDRAPSVYSAASPGARCLRICSSASSIVILSRRRSAARRVVDVRRRGGARTRRGRSRRRRRRSATRRRRARVSGIVSELGDTAASLGREARSVRRRREHRRAAQPGVGERRAPVRRQTVDARAAQLRERSPSAGPAAAAGRRRRPCWRARSSARTGRSRRGKWPGRRRRRRPPPAAACPCCRDRRCRRRRRRATRRAARAQRRAVRRGRPREHRHHVRRRLQRRQPRRPPAR